jgi:hypothetical protein
MSRTARFLLRAVPVCVALATGCGTSASSDDATGIGGSSGSGGSSGAGGSGVGGTGGASARGGTGGGGGSVLASCPGVAPAPGQGCNAAASCFYEDCAGSGRTVATCTNGAWAVETGPCTGVFCQSQTCAVGQVCVVRAGGALLVDCASNTCGSGAIGCGCLQSCAGTCAVSGSLQTGVTIQCNTCPSNQCP